MQQTNEYTDIPRYIANLPIEQQHQLREIYENGVREVINDQVRMLQAGIDEAVKRASSAYFDAQPEIKNKKQKTLDVTNVRVMFFDNDNFMPLGDFAYTVVGTASEVAQRIASKGERLLDSKEVRQSQTAVYRRLRDEFGLSPADAASYFTPEGATPRERRLIKRRFGAAYGRYNKSKKEQTEVTKTAKRAPRKR